MHQTRPRSRGLFVHRVYVYRARIARKGYEVNDRNTGGRGSVVEKVSRFLAIRSLAISSLRSGKVHLSRVLAREKNLREEKGERATRSVPRKKS